MIAGAPLRAWIAAALLLAACLALAQVAVPPLAGRVTDLTSTLSADERGTLEGKLAALEKRDGSQVAVLLVPTVQPETIEQYATRVFEAWQLGRKGLDDGVLLVIAKSDRKLRIEVGYGLEGAIPDAIAKRVIDEEIVPRFRQGDFYGGIQAGVDRIVRLVEGEAMPAPRPEARAAPSSRADYSDLLFFGFVAAVVLGGILRSLFGRMLGAGLTGMAAGVATYLLVSAVAAAIVAIIVFAFTLAGGLRGGRGTGWASGGGWSSGGSWSSGGGGGFSGGGGSSGGGGASGGW